MTEERNDPPVPPGADAGAWTMTPSGRGRTIWWDPIYVGMPDAQGEQNNTVRITALQAATGRVDNLGLEININGSYSTDEAGLIAASIRDAIAQIEQFEHNRR